VNFNNKYNLIKSSSGYDLCMAYERGGSAGTWVRGLKSQEEAVRTASCKQEENSMVFVFE
jgi:hypothetical protein